jgi:hypothetical protein
MENGVWDAIQHLPPEDRAEAFDILHRIQAEGFGLPGVIPTSPWIRREWVAGWQILLPSNNVFMSWAPMEDDEGEYFEIAYPRPLDWEYDDE